MKNPSPAIIIATVALFASVSGASYATTQLPTQQQLPANVPDKSVGTKQIKGKAVTQKKIAKRAIAKGKIKPSAVRTGKINDQAVTTEKIVENGVTTSKIADGAVTGSKLQEGSVPASAIAPGVLPAFSTNVIYASVQGNGSVSANRSAGLTQQNVARQAVGVYCIAEPPVSASAQATLNGAAPGFVAVELAPSAIPAGCSSATSAVVRTFGLGGGPEDLPFSVQLTG